MPLKVGELARSSGLTVRTLHHYDEIGLLKPSARSDSGYRLYADADVQRLHGIQALRHLGLALSDIAALLDGEAPAPGLILEQQMRALERQIEQATELRERLALIRDDIAMGAAPKMGDWLQALTLMATYGKYFTSAELRKIFMGWPRIEADWLALLPEVEALIDSKASPGSDAAQVLARRWMALVHHWMDGDFELMQRWGDMYQRERGAHGVHGAPTTGVFTFMQEACDQRMERLLQHFDLAQLRRFRFVAESQWRAVDAAGLALLNEGDRADSEPAQALLRQWLSLVDQLVASDAVLRDRLLGLWQADPGNQAGSSISAPVRKFLLDTFKTLDPHVA